MKLAYLPLLLVIITMCLLPATGAAQCAMCKQAAEASIQDDPTSMARSLNKGILYLMAVPYLAIAFIFRKQLFQLAKKLRARYLSTGKIL